jgi:transcriptional regulator with GAF, ATPase, and Fis domain/energy-coupling factor transporter ATP-binding protein EcfA2
VWAVEDRATGQRLALKLLAEGAGEAEALALIEELTALGGLEGLGLPRVHRLGRLGSRLFLLRELVEGEDLAALLARGQGRAALGGLLGVLPAVTRLHRAGRVHGDLKPANILVGPGGAATLVDLGLSAQIRPGGTARGLTPGYGAPELLRGEAPSALSDVYALGATLREILGCLPETSPALARVAERATAAEPSARFPSADELASALRAALGLSASAGAGIADAGWPVLGLAPVVAALRRRLEALGPGEILELRGRSGSGKSTALRRLSWALAAEGAAVAWLEARAGSAEQAATWELEDAPGLVLIDDAGALGGEALALLERARSRGARVLVTSGGGVAWLPGAALRFDLPPLDSATAAELLRRTAPSLPAPVLGWLLARSGGRPGKLRAMASRLAGEVVVRVADAERILGGAPEEPGNDPLERAGRALESGRLQEAKKALDARRTEKSTAAELLRVRLAIAEGDRKGAAERLARLEARAKEPEERRQAALQRGRLALLEGDYGAALACAQGVEGEDRARAEALACAGVAESYLGHHEAAGRTLAQAVLLARRLGQRRAEALALTSLGFAHQRAGQQEEARAAYEEALELAQELGDAAAAATLRLNLASLVPAEEPAEALAHLEAAVDLGKKAGRLATVRQALLNLASLDLELGRLAAARERVALLLGQQGELSEAQRAQLLGLEATLAARSGAQAEAAALFERCARAYEALRRGDDAAEARVAAALAAARGGASEVDEELPARPGTHLARALAARNRGDTQAAEAQLREAARLVGAGPDRSLRWRILVARGQLALDSGRTLAGRRDGEEALALLEDAAARLPADLQQVFWSDPERQEARALAGQSGAAPSAPAEDRLARILEINRELAAVRELDALLERVLEHAAGLLGAERGCVLLVSESGEIALRASRGVGADEERRAFSRSVAEQVLATGEPLVTRSAQDDERLRGFASVHLLSLRSVACVPVRSPRGGCIGALYLETRSWPGALFERERSTLRAFADQAAIAIENARLLEENRKRAEDLAAANRELEAAQRRLRELLEQKRVQLESTRRDLKDTRAALRGHFGYRNLIGTSAVMRRLYALMDRVKDTDVPVLITGESGTGKEMVARAIHEASPRARHPFTGVNCGAIPATLLESELFGHVKGAFTGADRERRGLFRETEGGTLLLDEIGEMPTKMQAGLLRVLQERTVRPVGGTREESIDVRVVAATHRDLAALVEQGAFREDLLYRLQVVELRIPPLRERPEDIPLLVDHFLQIFAARYRRDKGSVSREAMRLLACHEWPGNVRQLQNVLLNAWVLSEREELAPDDFELSSPRPAPPPAAPRPDGSLPSSFVDHRASEKERILQALQEHGWNRLKAAHALGIPRRTFYRRLREHGIQ